MHYIKTPELENHSTNKAVKLNTCMAAVQDPPKIESTAVAVAL
jgi:hypothetical protein